MIRVNNILQNTAFLNNMEEIKQSEERRFFCKHQIDHLLSVARIMYINNLENALHINKEVIYAAALLHDIGRSTAYKKGTDHAEESANIAGTILPECGFNREETENILFAIIHHNDSVQGNDLCTLLRNADKASRSCFACSAVKACNWSDEKKNYGITV